MMAKRSKVLAAIPARYGSTRFPGKMLTPICGRPLIGWVIDRVFQARSVTRVVVATDDKRIRSAAMAAGAESVMTRADHPSGTDRVAEVAEHAGCDVVINVQGDEPLLDPLLIDAIARGLREHRSWDMATAACPIRSRQDLFSPSVVKVVCGEHGRALYFSRAPIPFNRDGQQPPGQWKPPLYWRHIGIYGYQHQALQRLVRHGPCRLEEVEKLEQLRALHLGFAIKVIETKHQGPGVDVPDDVAAVEAALIQQQEAGNR